MRRNAIRRLGHLLVPENIQTSIRDAFLVSTVINNADQVPIYPFNNRQVSIGEGWRGAARAWAHGPFEPWRWSTLA